jgi:hypothetical protein
LVVSLHERPIQYYITAQNDLFANFLTSKYLLIRFLMNQIYALLLQN